MIGDRAWADTKGSWAGAPNGGVTRPGSNITTDADGGLDDLSSKHTGGANGLFADGSARFIRGITTDGLIRRAFWAMGTRAGGGPSLTMPRKRKSPEELRA
jgi:prepilin-type processing-associated H-X9-DG protein